MTHETIQRLAESATKDLFDQNSDQALQAAIELMLTSRSTMDVVLKLRLWADYLEERR